VKVIEEEKISAEYKRIAVTLPLPQWLGLLASIPEESQKAVISSIRKQEISLDLEAIKHALTWRKKSMERTC
jgi:hypothetical protein